MSVYKRKFGTETKWCVYITFPNGKRYRKVVGTKKQAEEVTCPSKTGHIVKQEL